MVLKKVYTIGLVFCFYLLMSHTVQGTTTTLGTTATLGTPATLTATTDTTRLEPEQIVDLFKAAYPDALWLHDTRTHGRMTVRLNDKTSLLVQSEQECQRVDSNAKNEPPLCATLAYSYPRGNGGRYPQQGVDPGRIRNQDLLKTLYGATEDEVKYNCIPVNFLGKTLLFNQQQGAAAALARVSDRLRTALIADPNLGTYIFPLAGSFSWRVIKDSSRLSAHSFAIAIDLNVEKGVYWLGYPTAKQLEEARQHYPQAIVDAFEAEGFIWGGKWSAFDFMHFEYRPELLAMTKKNLGHE